MTLRQQQSNFIRMLADLIIFAYQEGYELTGGDLYARDGHKEGSFHYKRLAIDLPLFKDGVYLVDTEDYRPLGEYWIGHGGTWGGNFKHPDGNHFSYGE